MAKIIFFGNGKLAEYALKILTQSCEIIFHARTKEDLAQAVAIKKSTPEAHAVLASYGVLIKPDVLEVFEPEGILNIHPSLLSQYRGPSPIETAILSGDTDFSVSVMKLVKAMDAGPIYYQTTIKNLLTITDGTLVNASVKDHLYQILAETGATWVTKNLSRLPVPTLQDNSKATFTSKLTKDMGLLTPDTDTAMTTLRKIIAFQSYPKPKYPLFGKNCLILEAHMLISSETAPLTLHCSDGVSIALDTIQPEGKRPMDAKSFLNGYKK